MYTLKKKNGDFFEFFCAPNNIKRTRRRTQKLLLNAFLSKEAFFGVVCFACVFFFVFFCLFFCDIKRSKCRSRHFCKKKKKSGSCLGF